MTRMTADRARDVSESVRREIAARLERPRAKQEWIRAVLEPLPVEEAERAEFFGEELPVGLRLAAAHLDPPHRAARQDDVVAGPELEMAVIAEQIAGTLVDEQQVVAVGVAREVVHPGRRAPEP